MLSSTSLDLIPSDISMVKSNFSPLDSHRLTYGQRGREEGQVERFSFEFQSFHRFFALVFIPMSNSFSSFIPLSNFNECSDLLNRSLLTLGVKVRCITLERSCEFNRFHVRIIGIIIPVISGVNRIFRSFFFFELYEIKKA